jgi:hypothetical protein
MEESKEENTVELFDYISVIWKRKILIIVVILVCIGVGVGVKVKKLRSKPPPVTSYIADAIVKIGKKVKLVLSERYSSSVVAYIESPKDMMITVPLLYDLKVKGASGYHLDVEPVGAFSMLKLTLSGPDEGVERDLKELVDMLLDKHHTKVEDSMIAYNDFMERLEVDAEMLRENIDKIDADINEMKKKEEEYMVNIDRPGAGTEEGVFGGDRSAYLNMLYLKSIDRQKDLSNSWEGLRTIQRQLTMHQITLGNLEDYKTEVVSGIKSTAIVELEEEEKINAIAVAGVAGLIMSLCIAFFWEYIEESKSRRKGK